MKSKYTSIFFAGLFICLLSACMKDTNDSGPVSVLGRWTIVSDSTFSGVGFNNHPVDYKGQPGDYFDFRTDGSLDTKEGTTINTLHYQLTGKDSVVISSFGVTLNGVPETCHITTLTAHSLVITAPEIFTPGGIFGRKVTLSK
jgi:hypothetical protein